MIAVDTSALVALLFEEADKIELESAFLRSGGASLGAPTAFEFEMVALGRRGTDGLAIARSTLAHPLITIVPWDQKHAELALAAFDRFGKNRDAAGLNFGDCMSYAVAKALNAPLLYKGNDFAQTDIRSALG